VLLSILRLILVVTLAHPVAAGTLALDTAVPPAFNPARASPDLGAPDLWTPGAPMPVGRDAHVAVVLKTGLVLVAAGLDATSDGGTRDSLLYHPSTNEWTSTGDMPKPHPASALAVRLADGRVLIAGGYCPYGLTNPCPDLTKADVYNPDAGTWSETGDAPFSVTLGTLTLLHSGLVLAVASGGSAIFDPSYKTWRMTLNAIETPRVNQTATLLADGHVLVVGGNENTGDPVPLASVELFDPDSEVWTDGTPLPLARLGQAAVRLADGRILVAGGEVAQDGGGLIETNLADVTFRPPKRGRQHQPQRPTRHWRSAVSAPRWLGDCPPRRLPSVVGDVGRRHRFMDTPEHDRPTGRRV
jgi:hypothetical protein